MSDVGARKKKVRAPEEYLKEEVMNQAKGATVGALIGLQVAGVPGAVTGGMLGRDLSSGHVMNREMQKIMERLKRRDGPWRVHPDGTMD